MPFVGRLDLQGDFAGRGAIVKDRCMDTPKRHAMLGFDDRTTGGEDESRIYRAGIHADLKSVRYAPKLHHRILWHLMYTFWMNESSETVVQC